MQNAPLGARSAAGGAHEEPQMSEPLRGRLSRRQVFAAAGTAGALTAIAAAVPRTSGQADPQAQPKPAPEKGGGYQVTQHVLRYYETTRV